tara:strand:+ start:3925 stop:4464 length:540 start_codon:yes stop_codon:yes gene_type:complete
MSNLSRKEYSNINSFISRMRSPVKKRDKSPIRKEKKRGKKSIEDTHVKIPIYYTEQGFYICKLKINKVTGIFLLDTGSNSTCVDLHQKEKFKMISNQTKEALSVTNTITIESTGNNEINIGGVKINEIEIDLVDLTNIKESVNDLKVSKISGILGNRLLYNFSSIIDYENNSLFVKIKT